MPKWGNLIFESTESLSDWKPLPTGGIYAIISKKNPISKPNDDTVIYFGKVDNFTKCEINESHPKYNCWKKHAHQGELYVSVAVVFGNGLREQAEQQLIAKYHPICNK